MQIIITDKKIIQPLYPVKYVKIISSEVAKIELSKEIKSKYYINCLINPNKLEEFLGIKIGNDRVKLKDAIKPNCLIYTYCDGIFIQILLGENGKNN